MMEVNYLNNNILFSIFFVLILVFSVSAIEASDVNITDSSLLDNAGENYLQIENSSQLEVESEYSNTLSNEDIKNHTELVSNPSSNARGVCEQIVKQNH